MVLSSYQSFKSQDSLGMPFPSPSGGCGTTGGMMMMHRTTSTSSSFSSAGPSSLNLSALTLSETHHHHPSSESQLSSFGNHQHHAHHHHHHNAQGVVGAVGGAGGASSSVVGGGLKRGWGSAQTRQASTSLSTMAEDGAGDGQWSRPVMEQQGGEKDGWGYFVDALDDEDEDALMW